MSERSTLPHDISFFNELKRMGDEKSGVVADRLISLRAAEYDLELSGLIYYLETTNVEIGGQVTERLTEVCAEVAETYGLSPDAMNAVIETIRVRIATQEQEQLVIF